MRKHLLILFLILYFCSFGQQKLCYDVYYFIKSGHSLKTYKHILLFTNGDLKAQNAMKRIAEKRGYNISLACDLFPPIRSYSDEEIADGIIFNKIDAIMSINLDDVQTVGNVTYGSYSWSDKLSHGSVWSINKPKYYTSLRAELFEPNSKNDKEFYCEGGAKGNSYDVLTRTFDHILAKFYKIGVAQPTK